MIVGCMLYEVLQENQIFRQSLNRLNQKTINGQPPKLRFLFFMVYEFLKSLPLFLKVRDDIYSSHVVLTIFEIDFEERTHFDDDIEHNLVVVIFLESVVELTVELLIQFFNLFDVAKDGHHFCRLQQFTGTKWVFEVTYDQRNVVNVLLFCVDKLFNDMLSVGEYFFEFFKLPIRCGPTIQALNLERSCILQLILFFEHQRFNQKVILAYKFGTTYIVTSLDQLHSTLMELKYPITIQYYNLTMTERLLQNSSFKYRQEDPDYKGQPLDSELKNGPVQDRPCRDLIFLVLYIGFWVGLVYIAYLGFNSGDPKLLAAPYNSNGNHCGVDANFIDYPYVFGGVLLSNTSVYFACVSSCPLNGTTPNCSAAQTIDCSSAFVPLEDDYDRIVTLCVPAANISSFDYNTYGLSVLTKGFSDLKSTWKVILGCVGIAFLGSIILSLFIRLCAGVIVWITILLFIAFLGVFGTLCHLLPNDPNLQNIVHFNELPANLQNGNFLKAFSITLWCLCGVSIILVLCMYKQIRISIGIMKAAADFVRQQMSTYLLPIFITILQTIFLAFWIFVILYLFSNVSSGSKVTSSEYPYGWVSWNTTVRNLVIYYLFGLLWVIMFLSGLSKFLTASVAAIWYFEAGEPSRPILRSICRAIKSFGSIALGSFLLAVVIAIRFMLQLITKYLKETNAGGAQQKVVMFMVKCASCCVACFQRFIRFITQNAYIMMAITGKGFCESATEGFYLVVRSAGQVAVSHGTVAVFMLIGKLFITILTASIGYIIITNMDQYKLNIFSPLFPVLAFIIVSYPIASTFMEFFGMASNTLLLCYCIEKDLSEARGKCPPALAAFLRQYANGSEFDR